MALRSEYKLTSQVGTAFQCVDKSGIFEKRNRMRGQFLIEKKKHFFKDDG